MGFAIGDGSECFLKALESVLCVYTISVNI